MMKRWCILLLLACLAVVTSQAQRVTHRFDDVSMSDALKLLQSMTEQYHIVFIYNELEDFRVTTNVKNQSIPNAIRQLISFYPITMTVKEGFEIYVECTNKTKYRLMGRLVDEKARPLEYANVVLYNPADSSFITGCMSNASGFFVIPVEQPTVIARISHVGYKTVFKRCQSRQMGTIKMERSLTALNETLVTSPSISIQQEGANLILSNLDGTVMGNAGTALEMLKWTPGIVVDAGENILVIGRGNTLVYINNRLITNITELKMLNSNDIKRIEVIRDPDARYPSTADAVIKLYTYNSLKNYLGASLTDIVDVKHKISNATTLTIDGKYDKLSGNVSLSYNRYYSQSSNCQYTRANSGRKNDTTRYDGVGDDYRVFAGINYALTPKSILGIQYNGGFSKTGIDLQVSRGFSRGERFVYTANTNDMKLKSNSHSVSTSYSWQQSDSSQLLVIADYATSHQTNHQSICELNAQVPYGVDYYNDYDIITATARYDFVYAGCKHNTGLEWGHANNDGQATKVDDTQKCTRDNDWAAAYYIFDRRWKQWRANIGLRYEFDHTRTIQDVVIYYNKNYHDLLPSLNIGYRVNDDLDFSAGYRRTLVRPTYNQLRSTFYFNVLPHSSLGYSYLSGSDLMVFDISSAAAYPSNSLSPNIVYISTDDLATGNPELRPTITDRVALTAQFRHLTAQLSYRGVSNAIQTIYQLLSSGTLCQCPVNISRMHAWTLDLDYAYSNRKIFVYLLASGTLPRVAIPSLGYYEIEKKPFGLLHGNIQYNVLEHLMMGCSVLYTTPWMSGYTRCNSILGLNLSLMATFFHGKLLLGANFNDVFNRSMSTCIKTQHRDVFNSIDVNNDLRSVSLMIRWTFNNITNPFKRHSGNDATLQRTQETVN